MGEVHRSRKSNIQIQQINSRYINTILMQPCLFYFSEQYCCIINRLQISINRKLAFTNQFSVISINQATITFTYGALKSSLWNANLVPLIIIHLLVVGVWFFWRVFLLLFVWVMSNQLSKLVFQQNIQLTKKY